MPLHWVSLLKTVDKNYHKWEIKDGTEYKKIVDDFKKTMSSSFKIKKIEVIQNKLQWISF